MKKYLLLATLLLSSTLLFSQIKFGIKAGVNFANIESNSQEFEDLATIPLYITTFNFDGLAELKLSRTLFVQSGISFSGKGYKIDYSFSAGGYSEALKGKATIYYLEIPLNTVAKFNAGKGKFLVGAGPYVAYGISGKSKAKLKVDAPGTDDDLDMNTNDDISFGNKEDQIKPLDFGLNLLAGYEFESGPLATLGYGLGLSNISNEEDVTTKNKVIAISLGYKF